MFNWIKNKLKPKQTQKQAIQPKEDILFTNKIWKVGNSSTVVTIPARQAKKLQIGKKYSFKVIR